MKTAVLFLVSLTAFAFSSAAHAQDLVITFDNDDTGADPISVGLQNCSQLTCGAPPFSIAYGADGDFTANINTTGFTFSAATLDFGKFQKMCRVTVSGLANGGRFISATGANTFAIEGVPGDTPVCSVIQENFDPVGGQITVTVRFQ